MPIKRKHANKRVSFIAAWESLGENLHLVSSIKFAELIKLMESCYRDVNIALANELLKIAEELEIDFFEVRAHANYDYCYIHLPSIGMWENYIPACPWFLIKEMEREKFSYARLLRTSSQYWAEKILLEYMKVNKPLSQVKICIKGIAFRQGEKEFNHSRNRALAKLMMEKGLDAYAFDDFLSKEEVERQGLKYIDPKEAALIFDCFSLKRIEKIPAREL